MKATELINYLKFSITNRFAALITGAPGIGKTDIITQATAELGADGIISHPVVGDPTDYKGLPFLGADGIAHFTPFNELDQLIKATRPTVFFLDDLGQATPAVQAACMQLILARRINGHKVSDQVTFMAATNRRQDKAGVSGILEPVKSRFKTILELEVDAHDWVKWALVNGMPTELIAFNRFKPELMASFEPTKEMTNSPCPRTIANIGYLQIAGLPKEQEHEVFSGAVGKGYATEYCTFLDMYRKLPSIDSIIIAPKNAPIFNDDMGTQHAIAGALGNVIGKGNIGSILTYLNRLDSPEFVISVIKDAITRSKDKHLEIAQTREFIEWSSKFNAELS